MRNMVCAIASITSGELNAAIRLCFCGGFMNKLNFVCPCLLGIEGLVADELRKMGALDVLAHNGRVTFSGDYNILARANICSRYAERVLILVGEFEARSFEELFCGVKGLPWENFIGKNDAFPVKGSSINSKLASVPDCQSIIKKAIVERLKLKYNLPWFEETGELYQIKFNIMKDKVSVMIDTSGAGLHKRGYRKISNVAPIKETIAAGLVNLAHVKENTYLVDPFCGSGTILIEAALYAMNIAPGIKRRFISETWKKINPDIWKQERKRAVSLEKRDVNFKAVGYDIDPNAVNLTIENAKKAGVSDKITTHVNDIRNFSVEKDGSVIICNPPYGERLLDKERAEDIYQIMGKAFRTPNFNHYYIISPDDKFEQYFGKRADKKRKLYNGMIKCQYYMYFK